MKKFIPFSLIVTAALVLAACGSRAVSSDNYAMPPVPEAVGMGAPASQDMAVMPAPVTEARAQMDPTAGTGGVAAAPVDAQKRIVIKNADLTLVVNDVEGRMKEIQAMAEGMGGFVVSSNLYQNYTSNGTKVPEAQVVVRVPADKLDEVMGRIKKDAVEIQSENVSGQDVTSEYVDLQSRLKNYEAAEAQLNDLLKTATDTTDVVTIFNQLTYYREQIEVVKGQIKYYDEAASLSAVSVHLLAAETIQPVVIGKWEPKGTALKAIQDLIDFSKGFVDFLIRFVIYNLPVLIMLGLPLYLVFLGARAIFRKLRGNKIAKKAEKEEAKQ